MGSRVKTGYSKVQECLPKIDVDLIGTYSIKDHKGTKLEEMALNLLPEANTVVVFGMEIYPEILSHGKPERTTGMASLNDLLDRHMEYLNGRLTRAAYEIAKVSHTSGLKAFPLPALGCPMDFRFLQSIFSYKHAAQAAGLGYIGRSSLLITPDFGPRVRLACCLTEAKLESQKVTTENPCTGCNICVTSCPAKALDVPKADESYAMNKFACSSFRSASGGCSECMRLCPVGT